MREVGATSIGYCVTVYTYMSASGAQNLRFSDASLAFERIIEMLDLKSVCSTVWSPWPGTNFSMLRKLRERL